MTKYPGLLLFTPPPIPPMPEPYVTGSAAQIYAYQKAHPGGDMDEEQQILNNEAVHSGNLLAGAVVTAYNSTVCRYWENGGPKNKYGLKLPDALVDLAQFYKPATDATLTGLPPRPSGIKLKTAAWELPAGFVLVLAT